MMGRGLAKKEKEKEKELYLTPINKATCFFTSV
jgi:hypothetical protein